MIKSKVLFLCSGNSCRTQMAEAFLRDLAGDRFDVISAGGDPTPLDPEAVRAMNELGHRYLRPNAEGRKPLSGPTVHLRHFIVRSGKGAHLPNFPRSHLAAAVGF